MELYYRRSKVKGRTFPTRVETVVIYLPDVRSCVPTRIEWDNLHASYKAKMEFVIKQESEGRIISTGSGGSDGGGDTSSSVEKFQANQAGSGGADGVKGKIDESIVGDINNKSQQDENGVVVADAGTSKVDSNADAIESAAASAAAASSNEKAQQFLFIFFFLFIFKTKFIF